MAKAGWEAWLGEGDLEVVGSAPLIYLLEDHAQFGPLFEGLFALHAQGRVQVAISTITVTEVMIGPLKHNKTALAKRYEKALAGFEVILVSQEIALTAARLRVAHGLRLPDTIQAATVLKAGAVALVTHDRDFSRLEGLRVLNGR